MAKWTNAERLAYARGYNAADGMRRKKRSRLSVSLPQIGFRYVGEGAPDVVAESFQRALRFAVPSVEMFDGGGGV